MLKHDYIEDKIQELKEKDSLIIDMKSNYSKRYKQRSNLIKALRPFVFEIHPY